jgi:hypothetical protein
VNNGVFSQRELPLSYSNLQEELVQAQARLDLYRDQLLIEFNLNVRDDVIQNYNNSAQEVNRLQVPRGGAFSAPILTVFGVYAHFTNIAATEAEQFARYANRLVQAIQQPSNVSVTVRDVLI